MSLVSEPLIHLEQLSQMNKAAGDPLRLGVLQLLRQGAFGVLELFGIISPLWGIIVLHVLGDSKQKIRKDIIEELHRN